MALAPAKLDWMLEEPSEPLAGVLDGFRLDGGEGAQQPDLDPHAITEEPPAPGAYHMPVDRDDVGEEAAEREDRGLERMVGVEGGRPVAIGHGVLVEVGQQVRDRWRLVGRTSRGIEPIVNAVDDLVFEVSPGERHASPSVGHGEAGPPHEVRHLGRTVTPEAAV